MRNAKNKSRSKQKTETGKRETQRWGSGREGHRRGLAAHALTAAVIPAIAVDLQVWTHQKEPGAGHARLLLVTRCDKIYIEKQLMKRRILM